MNELIIHPYVNDVWAADSVCKRLSGCDQTLSKTCLAASTLRRAHVTSCNLRLLYTFDLAMVGRNTGLLHLHSALSDLTTLT